MAKLSVETKWQDLTLGLYLPYPGSSKDYHTGSWRSMRPIWKKERCVRCGVCDMFCPEAAVKPNEAKEYGANLDYCKGCGICARECVTGAITMVKEEL
jgi:pyruvate ferredoxin oxidoreductase delta subunit